MVTWEQLTALEPRLLQLEGRIEQVRDDPAAPYFCANETWAGYDTPTDGFKAWVSILVGWFARTDVLVMQSEEAYELAYRHLYGLLPACRNCGCGPGWGARDGGRG
jgi:hypothetical protein